MQKWQFLKQAGLFLQTLAVFKLAQTYLYEIRVAVGPSMQPTLNDAGDVLIVDKITPVLRGYQINDIVLLKSPSNPTNVICKRIICGPGDSVSRDHARYLVPAGHIWVEGDNKAQSMDSRDFGPVSLGLVIGRVSLRVWPHYALL
jgi:signal peptidase I